MITKRDTFARTDADRNVQTASATRIALVAAVAMVIAFIVNALIRIVAVEVFDASGDDAPMVWGAILAATVVATAIAALVYWLLGRFTQRPARTFSIVAAIVLAISIIGPVTTPDIDGASRVAATAMHIAGAAIVVGLLTTQARDV